MIPCFEAGTEIVSWYVPPRSTMACPPDDLATAAATVLSGWSSVPLPASLPDGETINAFAGTTYSADPTSAAPRVPGAPPVGG